MNGHARRCRDAIEALGFVVNEAITEAHGRHKTYYSHPLAPGEVLSIYGGMSEQTCRVVIDRARQIAGLDSTNAKRRAEQVRERRQIERERRAEREARESAARLEREAEAAMAVAMRKAAREQSARITQDDARRRELLDLMRPGGGR